MFDAQFAAAADSLLNHIRADYAQWSSQGASDDAIKARIRQEMTDRFNSSLSLEVGSKYVKVVSNGGAHSFIVLKAGKFPVGTILKAASWKTPATNFSRGNILTGDLKNVSWTGAH